MPMVPLRFFRSRAFSAGNAANFLLNASIIGTVFFMAQFLQTAQGYGPLGAGVRLLPWTATLFVVAPIAGSLVNRVGERPLIVGGLALQAVGMAWVGLIASPSLPYAALITPLVVMGAGVSLAIAPTENAVISAVAANDIGKASGTFGMVARHLGWRSWRPSLAARAASILRRPSAMGSPLPCVWPQHSPSWEPVLASYCLAGARRSSHQYKLRHL